MPSPIVPEFITVHLGAPDSARQNVTVSFPDYIKNVASSEIYPTWPESAIRANIYAQISFALNRVFTEFYRSRGYSFDITNSTQMDQFFVPGRDIFDNINRITDEIFNSFVQRQGTVGPLFTQYCNGTTVTCGGLSQWGTVTRANEGLVPYEILQYYYGDDIDIISNVEVSPNVPSYPGYPISRGDINNNVRLIQLRLNRVSSNYPSIPKIYPIDNVFGENTESAVKQFQRIFNLTPDGIVGHATWYKLIYIYNGVKQLSELDSEGISIEEYNQQYPRPLRLGDSGNSVAVIQYYLAAVARFYDSVPLVVITKEFDEQTQNAVIAFQKAFGLTPDGIVGELTWQELYRAYLGVVESDATIEGGTVLFPEETLRLGSTGRYVTVIQQYLSTIADAIPQITKIPVTGTFGQQTQRAVREFQQLFGLNVTGMVGNATWSAIARVYSDIVMGNRRQEGQFPGYTIN